MAAVAIKQVATVAAIATVVAIATVAVAEAAMAATQPLAVMDSKIKVSDQWVLQVMVAVLLSRDRAAVALTLKTGQSLLATLALTPKSRISAKFSARRE